MAARGISPASDNGASLGSESKHWDTVYAKEIDVNTSLQGNYSRAYRRPAHAYSVGDIVRISGISQFRTCVCVKAGTTGSGGLTVDSPAEGALTYDGSVVWAIDSFADYDSTYPHLNSQYRGANITAYMESGLLSANLAENKFVNVYPGDFVRKTVTTAATTYTDKSGTEITQEAATYEDVIWYVGGNNTYYGIGSSGFNTNHILLIAGYVLQKGVKMNPTASTDGGYVGSDMWRIHMPIWSNAIKNAFGSTHVLSHKEYLTNAVDTQATAGAWVDVDVNIPNEQILTGAGVYGSVADFGETCGQLPIFVNNPNAEETRWEWEWLRTVKDATHFCIGEHHHKISYYSSNAVYTNGGIRPYFLYY